MVRVAGLSARPPRASTSRSPDGRSPRRTLAEIRERVLELHGAPGDALEARPAAGRSPRPASWSATSRTAPRPSAQSSSDVFERQLYPMLTPLAVGPGQPFPYISGLSLSLGVSCSTRRRARSASPA